MAEPSVLIALASLFTTIGLWIYTWLREGRMRRWALADADRIASQAKEAAEKIAFKVSHDAEQIAIKLRDDATAAAAKTNADAVALASKNMRDAAALAQKVVEDAEKISTRLHESVEKVAAKVAENTTISTDAAKGAREAYSEANTINKKIADLQENLVRISEHIEKPAKDKEVRDRAAHEEAMFNQRVKTAIDKKLEELNGNAPAALRRKRKTT